MKSITAAAIVFATAVLLSGCQAEEAAAPPPFSLSAEAMGRYCGMNVLEHAGPKGQIIVDQFIEPFWFSSARDAVAFTMLPEEPRDIRAVYVSDMGAAPTWDEPGANNWIEARTAWFVIGSGVRGGMGARETIPFSDSAKATEFADRNGGKVVRFDDIPRDYVLGDDADGDAPASSREQPGGDHG